MYEVDYDNAMPIIILGEGYKFRTKAKAENGRPLCCRRFQLKNIGWDVPRDVMTLYAQMAEYQDHGVIVEEKRKRPDDEIDLTKKHETRERKRKEMLRTVREPLLLIIIICCFKFCSLGPTHLLFGP